MYSDVREFTVSVIPAGKRRRLPIGTAVGMAQARTWEASVSGRTSVSWTEPTVERIELPRRRLPIFPCVIITPKR